MTLSAARVLTPPLQRFPIGLRAANKLVVDLHRHDLTRTAQLKALGNAQQPQVAYQAWRLLTGRLESEAVAA